MDNTTFFNMDSYHGGSGKNKFGLTFKQIILMHINRCVQNGSVEWHGGYWQEKSVTNYTIEKVYVQNSREVYCNSITMLRCLLLGYYDDKIREEDVEIYKQLEELNNSFKEKDIAKAKAEYLDKKILIFIKLFEELVMLCKRHNFFEEEAVEDEF